MSADDTSDTARRMDDEADRMQERLDELGDHVEEASDKARYTREMASDDAAGRDAPAGEMQTPEVSRDPGSGDADPGDPLDAVVGEDDVTPGEGEER